MKKAVILINIGSPDELNVFSTYIYLRKFLMDKKVIDIPPFFRFLLVNLIIAPFRASKSFKAYKKISIDASSPLIYYSEKLKEKLQQHLGENYLVTIAMMYGKPLLKKVLQELKSQRLSDIIVIPLYPQYASSTTGSALETFFNEIKTWTVLPNIKIIHTYYNHPEFVHILAHHIQKHLPEKYDFILFSYHGLPTRHIIKADKQFSTHHCNLDDCCRTTHSPQNQFCYRWNCLNTTNLLVEKLNIDKNKTTTCFQSRLGQSEWLKPYAIDTIKELAQKNIKKLVVVSPAFVTDCLETLFEIKIEYEQVFKQYGGEELVLIPSLNAEDNWVEFLKKRITE